MVFEMLCIYREYKSVFPEVILNYNRGESKPVDIAHLEEVLAGFRKKPGKIAFTILFDLLKRIDQTIVRTDVRQFVFDDGILMVGDSYWKAFSLIPGEYPFAKLRFIHLNSAEVSQYRNTPVVSFSTEGLNIATCSLGAEALTLFEGKANLRGGQYGVYAKTIAPGDVLIKKIESSLDWAKEGKADVVLFPELSIDQNGLNAVETWIQKNVDSGEAPKIIVAGSFYHLVEENYRNRATIYLTGRGGASGQPFTKLNYDKRVPFSATVPHHPEDVPDPSWREVYKEAKDHGDKVVVEDFVSGSNITLVNTSNGVFGFAICRDVLDLAGVGNPLEKYLNFVDFMMIISYNEGVTNLFEAQGEDFARWHNCAVTYVNAGQAVPEPDKNDIVKMGYCIFPYDRSSSGIGGEIYYGKAPGSSLGHLGIKTLPKSGNILYTISKTS